MPDKIDTSGLNPTEMGPPGWAGGGPFLPTGHVVDGQFEIVRPLGRGGMGVVYEAKNQLTGERVALKTILPAHLANPIAVERFVQEINAARRLRHPNIVAVHDVGQDGRTPYFTMEFIEGTSLRKLMQERGRFDLPEAVAILKKLCDALEYAHQYMVHRDVSPENVVVLPEGDIKLLDFGLARMADRQTMTMTGSTLGKAQYMSPEQLKDAAHVDGRTDIYALGVMFFEMLSGELPGGMRRLGDLVPDLPPECDQLLSRTLVPQERRYAMVAQFGADMERCLHPGGRRAAGRRPQTVRRQKPHPADERTKTERRQRIKRAIRLIAVALAVLVAFLGVVAVGKSAYSRAAARKAKQEAEEERKQYEARVARDDAKWEAEQEQKRRRGTQRREAEAARLKATEEAQREAEEAQRKAEQERVWREGELSWIEDGKIAKALLPDGQGIEFVWCPPGTFVMGSPESEQGRANDETQHQVTLTRGFWLGKCEVTRTQWKTVMGDNSSRFKYGDLPVVGVSWDDCQGFLKKLNTKSDRRFRLPTEAEWEYACRAGSTTAYCFGNDEKVLSSYAWYNSANSSGNVNPHPVGELSPNDWGLHDMHGNVFEWCQDWYGDYPDGPATDPTGPKSGGFRVVRGVSWFNKPGTCRSAFRDRWAPENRDANYGFRLLRTP